MIVEELVGRIGLDFTGAANAAKAVKTIDGIKGAFIGVGGIFAALGVSLAANTLSVAGAIDDYSDFGDTVGASVETLQTLTFAAEQAGGSFGDVQIGLRALTNLAGEAAKGNTTAADSFAEIGVRVTNAKGKLRGTEDILRSVADGLEKLPPGSARVNAAMGLLGRGAIKLIPALSNGSAGLADLRAEAERIGFVLDERTTKRFQALGDSLDNLKARFTGFRNLLGKAFLPVVEKATKALISFLDKNGKTIVDILGRIGSVIGGTFSLVTRAIGFVVDGFMSLADFSPVLAALTVGAFLFAAAWLSPAIAIGLLAVALGILAEDFNAFLEGKPSALGDLIGKFETLRDVVKSISDLFSGNLGALIYDALNPNDSQSARAKRTFGQQAIDSADNAIAAQRSTGVTDNAYNATGATAIMPFGLPVPAGESTSNNNNNNNNATNTNNNATTTNNVQITVSGAGDPNATAQAVLAAQMRASTKRK